MKKILKRFWPFLCIIALWFAFSFPYFAHGLVPFPSDYLVTFFPPWNASYGMPVKNNAMPDVISQIYPWKKLTIDTWKSNAVPLWNPYSFSGTPLAANYQSAVFSPFNLIFFILPFVDAWSVLVLLQPLLAGIGTYLFLRRLARSQAGSAIGAIGFMFCGFMTTWMAYGTLGYAIAFLPWALWAVTSDFIKKSALSKIILAATIALSFVSGHFQISVYVFTTVIAFIGFKTIQTKRFSEGLRLLIYSFLGLGLAAPQLLLSFDAYRNSMRSTSFTNSEVIPWSYFITGFAPDFYGNPVTRNDWFGHYAEWSSYVGVVPFILSGFAFLRKWKGDKLFFIILGIIALLCAYPTPLNALLFQLKLPAVSTSAASRIIVLWSFALCILSSSGFDEILNYSKAGKKRVLLKFCIFSGVTLGLLWCVVLLGKPLPPQHLAIAERNLILSSVLALMTLLLIVGRLKKNKFIFYGTVGILLTITIFDSYRFAAKWMPFESRELLYPQEESLRFLGSRIGNDRVFGNVGNEVGGTFRLPLIEGYDALYQGRYAQFINATSNGIVSPGSRSTVQFNKQGQYKSEALQLLGVRYIYHRLSDGRKIWAFPYWEYPADSEMKQIYYDTKYEVFEYKKAYPRAFLASAYLVRKGDQQIVETLFAKDFNRRETLVLEEKPLLEPAIGSGSAEIVSYQPNNVIIKTSAETAKLLFLSDVYDPGWRVTIDGMNSKLYRADYDFRAVAVPKGTHIVQFSYFPDSLRMGLALWGLAFVVMIGLATTKIQI